MLNIRFSLLCTICAGVYCSFHCWFHCTIVAHFTKILSHFCYKCSSETCASLGFAFRFAFCYVFSEFQCGHFVAFSTIKLFACFAQYFCWPLGNVCVLRLVLFCWNFISAFGQNFRGTLHGTSLFAFCIVIFQILVPFLMGFVFNPMKRYFLRYIEFIVNYLFCNA